MQEKNNQTKEITTFKSKNEMALEYGITSSTFYVWLVRIGFYTEFPDAKHKQLLRPIEQNFIISKLDEA